MDGSNTEVAEPVGDPTDELAELGMGCFEIGDGILQPFTERFVVVRF